MDCDPSLLAPPPYIDPRHSPFVGSSANYAVNDHTSSTPNNDDPHLTTARQHAALILLRDFDDGTILAWLSVIRSLQPGYQHSSQSEGLSNEVFEALSTLKRCSNSLILAWLQSSRSVANPQILPSSAQRTTARFASQRSEPRGPVKPLSVPRSSVASSSSASTYGGSTSYSTPRTSLGLGPASLEQIEEHGNSGNRALPSSSSGFTHPHWCFKCDSPRTFVTCDGWKRHMKEHGKTFTCMPNGPAENTEYGHRCSFCNAPHPNKRCAEAHCINPCAEKSKKARSYTRKTNLMKHLESHGIADGSDLAARWEVSVKRKHFSCGFCISAFYTVNDQLNHIDVVHFQSSQDIHDWDNDTVIRGLLLPPQINRAWREMYMTDPQTATWDQDKVKRLQDQLETGSGTPRELAKAAFEHCLSRGSPIANLDMGQSDVSSFFSGLESGDSRLQSPFQPFTSLTTTFNLKDSQAGYSTTRSSEPHDFHEQWDPQNAYQSSLRPRSAQEPSTMGNFGKQSNVVDEWFSLGSTFDASEEHITLEGPSQPYIPWVDERSMDQLTQLDPAPVSDGDHGDTGSQESIPPHAPANTSHPAALGSVNTSQFNLWTGGQHANSVHAPNSASISHSSSVPSMHRKSPSIVTQLRRRLPRRQVCEPTPEIPVESDFPMDLDFDYLQYAMRDEEQTRSVPRG